MLLIDTQTKTVWKISNKVSRQLSQRHTIGSQEFVDAAYELFETFKRNPSQFQPFLFTKTEIKL
jgi:glycerol-3-phosphate O-acyltransferase